ncbi:MAG TPA: 2-oxo-4-hydroxy-4-carboxy-5-ureidoimidazoline decarboxylase [Acidimicrobiia bacterium]|nr:2-oxo-4-hydroxy-4-carboxy-5-ureidoimidazoline decarboxylase [Acidimicrobiia bacterium]
MDLADLNRAEPGDAKAAFLDCCASTVWAEVMTEGRPYQDLAHLLADAEEQWWELTWVEWVKAFASHPKVGERRAGTDTHTTWSRDEQSGVGDDGGLAAALAEANKAYEDRFGYTFIVFASGKTGEEMLALCRERLGNDDLTELRVAATEQARITNLRLRKMLGVASSE